MAAVQWLGSLDPQQRYGLHSPDSGRDQAMHFEPDWDTAHVDALCIVCMTSRPMSRHRASSGKQGMLQRRSMLHGGAATEQAALCEAAREVAGAQAGAAALLGLPLLQRPLGGLAALMLRPARIAGALARSMRPLDTDMPSALCHVRTM